MFLKNNCLQYIYEDESTWKKTHKMHKNAIHKFHCMFYKLFYTVNKSSVIQHI